VELTLSQEDPRLARSRRAVLDATRALLAENGLAGFSVDAVVERSGVAKSTIYRHWPRKTDLVLAAADSLDDAVGLPDTQTLRSDLVAYVLDRMHEFGSPLMALTSGVTRARTDGPGIADALSGIVVPRLLAKLHIVIDRARERGEVRPDVDNETIGDLIAGAIFFRRVMARRPTSDADVEKIIDGIVTGIANR
jgi:AcrR family transcriptional regulator